MGWWQEKEMYKQITDVARLLCHDIDIPGPYKAVSSLRTKPKRPHLTALLNLPQTLDYSCHSTNIC